MAGARPSPGRQLSVDPGEAERVHARSVANNRRAAPRRSPRASSQKMFSAREPARLARKIQALDAALLATCAGKSRACNVTGRARTVVAGEQAGGDLGAGPGANGYGGHMDAEGPLELGAGHGTGAQQPGPARVAQVGRWWTPGRWRRGPPSRMWRIFVPSPARTCSAVVGSRSRRRWRWARRSGGARAAAASGRADGSACARRRWADRRRRRRARRVFSAARAVKRAGPEFFRQLQRGGVDVGDLA